MLDLDKIDQTRVAIIGLGYVGLPLAVEYGRHYDTVGFDINAARVAELQSGRDSTLEASPEELAAARRLRYTTDLEQLRDRDVFIVTVPTPIDDAKRPASTGLASLIGELSTPFDLVMAAGAIYALPALVFFLIVQRHIVSGLAAGGVKG